MIPRAEERAKTIVLKSNPGAHHEEGRAKSAVTILPGHLIVVDSTSADLPRTPEIVKLSGTAGADVPLRIAKEDFYSGRTIWDAYVPGDVIPYHTGTPGDVLMVRVANDFVATPGALLKSHTDGTFIAHGGTGKALVEVADNVDYTDDDVWGDVDDIQNLCRVVVL